MIKKLDGFDLVSYDKYILEHREFKYSLINDIEFQRYFGQFFIKNADEIFDESNDIEVKKAYLIQDESNIIGMVRLFSYHASGVVTLQYAISPNYRKQGYGTKILKSISEYLLNNGINCINLDIDKSNVGSIICARNSGYEKEEELYRLKI